MNGATHLIAGLAVSIYGGYTSPLNLIVAGASALTPDIDTKNSLLGRLIPVLPSIVEKTLGHRTITHSLIFTAFYAFLIHLFLPDQLIPFLIGYVSHLVLDIFTGGVPLLYPINRRFSIHLGIPSVFVESLAILAFGVYLGISVPWAYVWELLMQNIPFM